MNALRSLPLERLKSLRLTASAPFRSRVQGEWTAKGIGGGMVFEDRRPYSPGDDLRRVDWRAAARADRVLVKRTQAESAMTALLLIDASLSMTAGEPSPFESAKRIAYALAFLALRRGDSAAVAAVGSRKPVLYARGRAGLARLERYLERLEPAPKANFARWMRGRGVNAFGTIILLSDMLLDAEECAEGLKTMAGRGSAAHLVSRLAEAPEPPAEASVTDIETGESRSVAWNAERSRAYDARFQAHLSRIEAECAQKRIRYARLKIEAPIETLFYQELRAAGIVAEAA